MDNKKNRPDLLAAGRKKLDQYRNKKDKKGSKSSTKAGKSDHDRAAGVASAAESPSGSRKLPEKEARSGRDTGVGIASSSVTHVDDSQASDIDVATVDPLSVGDKHETDTATNTSTSAHRSAPEGLVSDEVTMKDNATEDKGRDSESSNPYQAENIHNFSAEHSGTTSRNSDSLASEMQSGYFNLPMPADVRVPPDLADASNRTVDAQRVGVVDQVTDEADHFTPKQVARSSGAELGRDARHDLSGLAVATDLGLKSIIASFVEVGPVNEIEDVSELSGASSAMDIMLDHSFAVPAQTSLESHESSAVSPEPEVHQGDTEITVSEEKQDLVSAEWVGAEMPDKVQIEGCLVPQDHDSEEAVAQYKRVDAPSDSCILPISIPQLVEVIQRLDEDAFRSLLKSRELALKTESTSAGSPGNDAEPGSDSQPVISHDPCHDAVEGVKEHLYVASIMKDVCLLQIDEQSEQHMALDSQHNQVLDQMTTARALVSEVQGRNESLSEELSKCKAELQGAAFAKDELEQQSHSGKAEVLELSSRVDELQIELDRSRADLSSLSAELVHCLSLMEVVEIDNDNLTTSLSLAVEEKKKLTDEKEFLVLENEKLLADLAKHKDSLSSLQEENVNLNHNLTSSSEERRKFEEAKEKYVCENEKLLTNWAECKALVEVLQVEKTNLSGSLTLAEEEKCKLVEDKEHFVTMYENLSLELVDYKNLVEGLQMKCDEAVHGLKEANLRIEQLTEENEKVVSQFLQAFDKVEGPDTTTGVPKYVTPTNETDLTHQEGQTESFFNQLTRSDDGVVDAFDNSVGFVNLKRHLGEVEKIIQELESAIERMHSHTVSSDQLSGQLSVPVVSKLIQAFESKAQNDDADVEEAPVTDHQLLMKQARNMRVVLRNLLLDTENAWALLKGERNRRINTDSALEQLKVTSEALEEHNNSLEAANVELIVLYEFIEHHMSDINEKKSEFLLLHEAETQRRIVLEAANNELVRKLGHYQLQTSKLEVQLDEMLSRSDTMASTITDRVEVLHKEMEETVFQLEQEWSSTATDVVQIIGKLDTLVGRSGSSLIPVSSYNELDIVKLVATSVENANKVIEDLQEKFEASCKDHEAMCSSYKDISEKLDDSRSKSELASDVLHGIHDKLNKLVYGSDGHAEQIKIMAHEENLFDLEKYDALIEQLEVFLSERLQLKSVNKELNSELTDLAKAIDELKKRVIGSNTITKLVEDAEGAIKVEDAYSSSDTLEARTCSLISFLHQKYKEAHDADALSRESDFSKEVQLRELQQQVDILSFSSFGQGNEVEIYKLFLRQGAEQLAVAQAELKEKVHELEQSEQRVSSVREKLSIAVSKGKGLIVQRDNLKQSLAETSNELEKCSQELQLRDARLWEVEEKLKTYSEAGERVEALESELSYIRNSATALRESFLLKDSVLQRIEEILEDLELPEHFHSRDTIEKVDWLARSVAGYSLPPTDWDQKSSIGGGSHSEAGFVTIDAWKEEAQPNSSSGDDLRKKYDELQSKFYGLAEQNEMLEQSLMERNNVVQRWEEILEKIDMPSQLRSVEPEERIEWLGSALSEAHHHCNSLQQKVEAFEEYCAALTADRDETQKRLSDIETTLEAVLCEKKHLSDSLELITPDYDKVSEKVVQLELENDKLNKQITSLQDKLVDSDNLSNEVSSLQEELVNKIKHQNHVESEIKRLQELIAHALQDSFTEDLVSSGIDIASLELQIRNLLEKHQSLTSRETSDGALAIMESTEETASTRYKNIDILEEHCVAKSDLEEVQQDLMCVKEERDKLKAMNDSLTHEIEALEIKRKALQDLLSQEEQKSASLREKLNVAVRKGKSLVQHRDSLKQSVEEGRHEVEQLKSEIKHRDSRLSDYEQKVKDMPSYQEKNEVLEADSLVLRNRLAETEYYLQEKTHMLSVLLNTLNDMDTGFEFNTSDPVEKLEQIGKRCHDLHVSMDSLDHDMRKSKKAAELLLAELNEVQERNDELQEELAESTGQLSQLSKERELLESAKREAFSRVEKLSSVRSEERNNYFAELKVLKSCVDQLGRELFDISDLLGDVFPKDLHYLQNLEEMMKSCLTSKANLGGMRFGGSDSIKPASAKFKEKFLGTKSLLDSKVEGGADDDVFAETCSLLEHQLQEFIELFSLTREELRKHSVTLDEKGKHVSEVADMVHKEVTSQKQSLEYMKENINRLESNEKEKHSESIIMHRNVSLLYDACSSSVAEIEKWKTQLVENGLAAPPDMELNKEYLNFADVNNIFSSKTPFSLEEHARNITQRLLEALKDFSSIQAQIIKGNQEEMKSTISNLQKEIHEKDIQKDRICAELVGQIKEAEASARSHLQDFHDLERRLEVMEEERNFLQQRVKELQEGETTLKQLEDKFRALNDTVTAKDQEIEVLMQALDEEETQMEGLTNKIGELERILQQKTLDFGNLEASRGKAMKKLSITVSKFDELHHLSAGLLSEVENLQSQLQERDKEISFLRQEVTRCTNDVLVASQMNNERSSDEIRNVLTWLNAMMSGVQGHDLQIVNDLEGRHFHEYQEIFQKQIGSLVTELENVRATAESRDSLLQAEKKRVEELIHKGESLELSLREKESILKRLQSGGDSRLAGNIATEITEAEPLLNNWAVPGTSTAPQVRSLRKVNNDQVAIAIDTLPGSDSKFEDEDDDKAHGFKSLTTSKIVPRFTRPVTDMVDGLWVSCERALMRQPALRLALIMYWAILHALVASLVV